MLVIIGRARCMIPRRASIRAQASRNEKELERDLVIVMRVYFEKPHHRGMEG
jgi:phospho-2-dehydro-3-deoxyheptonate aldolase